MLTVIPDGKSVWVSGPNCRFNSNPLSFSTFYSFTENMSKYRNLNNSDAGLGVVPTTGVGMERQTLINRGRKITSDSELT